MLRHLLTYQNPSEPPRAETFAEWQAGGLAGHLEAMITANVATVAPMVAATSTATGGGSSGGLLAAGTYYFVITETNGIGETTAGPESRFWPWRRDQHPPGHLPVAQDGQHGPQHLSRRALAAQHGAIYLYAAGSRRRRTTWRRRHDR